MHFSYALVLSKEVSLPALLAFPLRLNAEEVFWFYALHFTELWISFLANRQMVIRIRLEHTEHTRFLILWAGHKPAKEWGALSPSQGFHSPLLIGIKSLDLSGEDKQKLHESALPFVSAYSVSQLMLNVLLWTWTHQPRMKQETWSTRLAASGHFLGNWQQFLNIYLFI